MKETNHELVLLHHTSHIASEISMTKKRLTILQLISIKLTKYLLIKNLALTILMRLSSTKLVKPTISR